MYDYEGHVFVSEEPDGIKKHYLGSLLHREQGPAIEYPDGSAEWYLNGKRHRIGGPAVDGVDGQYEWWENGNKIRPPLQDHASSLLPVVRTTLEERSRPSPTFNNGKEKNHREKAREKILGRTENPFKPFEERIQTLEQTLIDQENMILALNRQVDEMRQKINDLTTEKKLNKPRYLSPSSK